MRLQQESMLFLLNARIILNALIQSLHLRGAGQMGQALYMTGGGNMDLYNPKPVERETVAEDVKSSVAPPVRNMIDVNNLTHNRRQILQDRKVKMPLVCSFPKRQRMLKTGRKNVHSINHQLSFREHSKSAVRFSHFNKSKGEVLAPPSFACLTVKLMFT